MKSKFDICDWLTTICCFAFITWALVDLAGCTTTTTSTGTGSTTVKQVDKEAIAQAVTLAIQVLNDPAVSNAVYQATNKK